MGGQWPPANACPAGCVSLHHWACSVSFLVLEGRVMQDGRAASQCVPGWVRVVTPLGVLGIGGKSPHARHGRFPSSPQLNCAYSTSGESPRTMRYGRWRWSYILWAPRPEPLKNTFPRREGGRAYARSDEDRRNVPIMSAVHKKGTILKAVPSYLTALYVVSCRHSSSAPSGAPSPRGKVLLR